VTLHENDLDEGAKRNSRRSIARKNEAWGLGWTRADSYGCQQGTSMVVRCAELWARFSFASYCDSTEAALANAENKLCFRFLDGRLRCSE